MKYVETLSQDPVMKSLIKKYGELTLTESKDYFDDLISAIIGQLLSNKAADTIYKRIAALCRDNININQNRITSDGFSSSFGQMDASAPATPRIIKSTAIADDTTGGVTPESILAVSDDALRAAGSSYGKIRCMKALAQAVTNKTVDLENIKNNADEEVTRQLTVIKGIGRWTADMFLIFSLAREDVFSFGDGGLNSALNRLYGNGAALNKSEIKAITEKWRPYRSYAGLYLWRSLDNR